MNLSDGDIRVHVPNLFILMLIGVLIGIFLTIFVNWYFIFSLPFFWFTMKRIPITWEEEK